MNNKYLIIDKSVLPDVFEKVIKVKELIKTGKCQDITEAVKEIGISRSSYYKYKDCIFTVSNSFQGHKVIISLLLDHKPGTLSKILDKLADKKGNILTINQDIPINNTANVTITFDTYNLTIELDDLIKEIGVMDNVLKIGLIAME